MFEFWTFFDNIILILYPIAAIRLKQLNPEISVCLIDKGKEIGSHLLSGACIETRTLEELFPNQLWKEKGAPLNTKAQEDRFYFLTETGKVPLPIIPQLHNVENGNYIVSIGQLCRWLATQAEELGVEIYTGFGGSEVLYDETGKVKGIATSDMGIAKDGSKKDIFQRGIELHAKQTIFAEGCRGSLTKTLYDNPKFELRKDSLPQTYGLGVKELWEVDPKVYKEGFVMHTLGWPLDSHTYGGTFLYMFDGNKLAIGFVVALDYKNPYLSPYQELQRFKHHPEVKPFFENAKCIHYGARTISEGGLQSLPKLSFPGGVLVGDTAGFLNVPKIKGIHCAMKSGMLSAEAVIEALKENKEEATSYDSLFKQSWLYDELYRSRNIRPYFQYGLYMGALLSGIDSLILRGKAPWTLKHEGKDNELTGETSKFQPIPYPKPDGKISFDLLTNLARSGTNHNHDQPSHLKLKNDKVPTEINLKKFGGPEQFYCPAKVYEYVETEKGEKKLQINHQNCLHCKACDIKDPTQNINWTVPEGGQGPQYIVM